ncbi:hypothetical protein V8Z80_10445 [Orrella sp. JC864]|uniref:ATP-grasp domain-containing protein n=1 Tax=Orrella sp. JC864 TaxID=3120298 RepID=UPI0030089EE1
MLPDTPRLIAIATYPQEPALHPDDARLLPALRAQGIQAHAHPWDAALDWRRYDAVLIRSTWDYVERHDRFLAWLAQLPVPLLNPAPTVRWNADKRYLLELAGAGINVVPSQAAQAGELPALVAARAGQTVIVKPCISAAARHTLRGQAGQPDFAAQLAALPPAGHYLVQPYIREIESQGEWSLVFFDGQYSHAVRKLPAAGDFRVQPAHGGSAFAAEPAPALVEDAAAVLAALRALGHAQPAYARVDGVAVDGRLMLMELELIEPLLHLYADPRAPARLAQAVARRLDGLPAA